ncbi:unnamed protein product [Didymodactylos carnosus]|uniref:Uncharacterized protein n=1 Tax=Didymodactylos carnosus TaxID=1234261 RepID=A0A814WYZ3_9BILA|nr:unnamed protein product [Didymodactylos carnosus]CAF3972889.1 unnamed protein product [Didymodactylos carnosus]
MTTKPFADISKFSSFVEEDEVLFSPGSTFQIKDVELLSDGMSLIKLKLCYEEFIEQLLKSLTNHFDHKSPLINFGQLLYQANQYDNAQHYYEFLMNTLPSDHEYYSLINEKLINMKNERSKIYILL